MSYFITLLKYLKNIFLVVGGGGGGDKNSPHLSMCMDRNFAVTVI